MTLSAKKVNERINQQSNKLLLLLHPWECVNEHAKVRAKQPSQPQATSPTCVSLDTWGPSQVSWIPEQKIDHVSSDMKNTWESLQRQKSQKEELCKGIAQSLQKEESCKGIPQSQMKAWRQSDAIKALPQSHL